MDQRIRERLTVLQVRSHHRHYAKADVTALRAGATWPGQEAAV
jgi:hypothetical protein